MSENTNAPMDPAKFRQREYEDPHFHDEYEVAPVADYDQQRPKKPTTQGWKLPQLGRSIRPHFEE